MGSDLTPLNRRRVNPSARNRLNPNSSNQSWIHSNRDAPYYIKIIGLNDARLCSWKTEDKIRETYVTEEAEMTFFGYLHYFRFDKFLHIQILTTSSFKEKSNMMCRCK